MKQSKIRTGVFLIIIIALLGFILWMNRENSYISKFLGTHQMTISTSTATLISSAVFTCDNSKVIRAAFFVSNSEATSSLGSVALELSDGRSMTLNQTISGSGARYANTDESFVFWNKGTTSFIEEGNDHTQTYNNCVSASAVEGTQNWNTFASATMHISIRYPQEYSKVENYSYTLRGPQQPAIPGVKFLIPASLYQGTNLSGHDTGVSIEQITDATSTCEASDFSSQPSTTQKTITDSGTTYSTMTTGDSGAGNTYEERIFAIGGSAPCTAIRYFIHSTNVGNYTPGTVKEFDKQALISQFDKIKKSLVITQ